MPRTLGMVGLLSLQHQPYQLSCALYGVSTTQHTDTDGEGWGGTPTQRQIGWSISTAIGATIIPIAT